MKKVIKVIIVESPTKARTIGKFVGDAYRVESSFGHIRDLPKSKLGIDVEHNFEPQYVTPRKAQPVVTKLKKICRTAPTVILATDEDREGEAIAWHLSNALNLQKDTAIERIAFHEITKPAIDRALANPRSIDMNLVNAQQARRVLDRLVGYKLSPFLWKKVAKGLSAGRVQSVALRLIMEREQEIRAFVPREYWSIAAHLHTDSKEKIDAALIEIDGKKLDQFDISDESHAEKIRKELHVLPFSVSAVNRKTTKRNPSPPFITSTLQQEAAKRLHFPARKTMRVAQALYENGLITYMRTDSTTLSPQAVTAARTLIETTFGEKYRPATPRIYKTKSRLAQEAHEAIRPTEPTQTSETLSLASDETRLYDLIWRRFIASQMTEALLDATTIDIGACLPAQAGTYGLRATGTALKFDGFLAVWKTAFQERLLPACTAGDSLDCDSVDAEQHFTEPPPRYNEAALIKALEQFDIGRPSTYASIISVIQDRNYAQKEGGSFHPTEIGELVHTILIEHFPRIVDIGFTARMEEQLDEIAAGEHEWHTVIRDFYEPFEKELQQKYETVEKQVPEEATDIVCEKCGKQMVVKFGRFGKFLACSGFPECKNAKSLDEHSSEPAPEIGVPCPSCTTGELKRKKVQKRGRARGKIFWGCSRYPECDYATWEDPHKTEDSTA